MLALLVRARHGHAQAYVVVVFVIVDGEEAMAGSDILLRALHPLDSHLLSRPGPAPPRPGRPPTTPRTPLDIMQTRVAAAK
jgi:hypothetical protein